MKKAFATAAALSLIVAVSGPAWAEGKHTGFSTDKGQGNLNNDNVKNNNGTTSVSGPKGQINKGNYDCNNCSQDLPGKNR